MLAEREPDLEVLLERVDVQRLEPTRLGAEPRRAGQTLQRRSAPEGKRRRDRVRRGRDVAVAQRGARLREQLLEPYGIDARAFQCVPVGRADDRLLSELGAEAGDVMMERVPRSGRELLPPQTVDQSVDVDNPTLPEREHRQQGLALRATHVRRRPARENLEGAEESDLKWFVHRRVGMPARMSLAGRNAPVKSEARSASGSRVVGTRLASAGPHVPPHPTTKKVSTAIPFGSRPRCARRADLRQPQKCSPFAQAAIKTFEARRLGGPRLSARATGIRRRAASPSPSRHACRRRYSASPCAARARLAEPHARQLRPLRPPPRARPSRR